MIKDFIDYLKKKNISKDDTLKLLKNENNLSKDEKNLVYSYCFPRQLLDRELPIRIRTYREKNGYSRLNIDIPEVSLIIEAGQTEQYRRYIKHLMHSFSDISKIYPVELPEYEITPTELKCGICDSDLMCFRKWDEFASTNPEEKESKEYLAFGSTETDIVLCKHCLLQLTQAIEIMNSLDPSFLDWTKRKF